MKKADDIIEQMYDEWPYLVSDKLRPYIKEAMEIYANQDKWIYNRPPELIEGQNYSENVLAEVEGFTDLQVMCFCYNPSEDEEECGFFWANCNKQLDGDAEFDDNYNVIKWQPIPKI